jgi:hypothetical protein
VISTASCGWGLAEATVTKALSISPPPTTNGVDKLYHQLAEIHAIFASQLAECTHGCRSYSTPTPVQARTGEQRDAIHEKDDSTTTD